MGECFRFECLDIGQSSTSRQPLITFDKFPPVPTWHCQRKGPRAKDSLLGSQLEDVTSEGCRVM